MMVFDKLQQKMDRLGKSISTSPFGMNHSIHKLEKRHGLSRKDAFCRNGGNVSYSFSVLVNTLHTVAAAK
jgi:hypothetical protein